MAVTDRDHIIAVSTGGKKELLQKPISKALEKNMSARNNVVAEAESKDYITVTEDKLPFTYEIIYPIIASGM